MLRAALIAVAVTAGGGAAWLALARSPEEIPRANMIVQQETAKVDVLVAAVEVPQGMRLAPGHLAWRSWPEDSLHPGFVNRLTQPDAVEELQGSVARGNFVAGEPILAEKLAPADANYLSAALEPGTRAVAVRISAESTAGGFVLPNDRVDVLFTMTCASEQGCASKSMTRAILRNVKVLAIGQNSEEGSAETVAIGKTATLQLTPAQAEMIVGAEASGMLSLALRPASETGESEAVRQEVDRSVRVRRAGVSETVVVK